MNTKLEQKIINVISVALISLSIISIFLATAIPAKANPPYTRYQIEEIKKAVNEVVLMLSDIIEDDYNDIEDKIKKDIIENGYDYDLTVNSYKNKDNPYKDIEYVNLISAYMVINDEYKKQNKTYSGIFDISFIKCDEEEKDIYIQNNKKIILYEEISTGKYRPCGYKYISEPANVPIYVDTGKGYYINTGEYKNVYPSMEELKYADVTLSCITPEELFEKSGINIDSVRTEYEETASKIKEVVTTKEIAQSILVELPIDDLYNNYLTDDMTLEQQNIVRIAQSLIGRVPYEYGGKASKEGYDTTWWTYDDSNRQKGLDCSGYVNWVFRTAGYPIEITSQLYSTGAMLRSDFKQIDKTELQVGDIGLLYNSTTQGTNHTGIYIGNGKWIHCSGSAKTVTVSEFHFRYFKRVINSNNFLPNTGYFKTEDSSEDVVIINDRPDDVILAEATPSPTPTPVEDIEDIEEDDIDEDVEDTDTEDEDSNIEEDNSEENLPVLEENIQNDIDNMPKEVYYADINKYSENDIYLLAQLITHEAESEGLNGWIAVGEVVKNRIDSGLFPNTVSEVVYQKGQFSNSGVLSRITPKQEIIQTAQMVLNGNLTIIGNSNVLYFRNPQITSGIPASQNSDWGRHEWFTYVGHHAFYVQ